jgi:hypothetical protein
MAQSMVHDFLVLGRGGRGNGGDFHSSRERNAEPDTGALQLTELTTATCGSTSHSPDGRPVKTTGEP